MPITVWTRSHVAGIYWKTGKQSQQHTLSEIKQAALSGGATPMKSCIYSLVIKNHFINLALRLNLYSKILTRSVAMNEQYLTLNLWAAVIYPIQWKAVLEKCQVIIFIINEASYNTVSSSLRPFNLCQEYSPKSNRTVQALLWLKCYLALLWEKPHVLLH